jgi:LmbE family N-acetylglucosaminyl deacetylase
VRKSVLAFFAHPDDETMLAGGLLALLARSGCPVHYLCATRGEGGELGEPPLCTRQELGRVREQELKCAVANLGGSSLTFLDYPDPEIGPGEELYPYTTDPEVLGEQVAAVLSHLEIDALITHGSNGEYGHPAHRLTHQAVRHAVESLASRDLLSDLLLYTVAATFQDHPYPRLSNADDPAHMVLDVRDSLEQKIQAAFCHRTQNALFVRRRSQEAGRLLSIPEVVLPVESLHRVCPPVESALADFIAEALKPWVVSTS